MLTCADQCGPFLVFLLVLMPCPPPLVLFLFCLDFVVFSFLRFVSLVKRRGLQKENTRAVKTKWAV